MRKACLDAVAAAVAADPLAVFIGSDLGAGTLDGLRAAHPDRFLMEGICEQALVGLAAGMALEGRRPWVHTIATFLTRRCYEQVAVDVCLHGLPVRLLGGGGGLVYTPLGPTHEAIEDLAIMRVLPGMTVIAPADPLEMRHAVAAAAQCPGPVYLRIARGGEAVVTPDRAFSIGAAIPIRPAGETLIITTGTTLSLALVAADRVASLGRNVGILHVPTLKPFDGEGVLRACGAARRVITIEEHLVSGGLGSAVAEILAGAALSPFPRLVRIGIPDRFPHRYGNQAGHLAHLGISVEGLVAAIMAEPA